MVAGSILLPQAKEALVLCEQLGPTFIKAVTFILALTFYLRSGLALTLPRPPPNLYPQLGQALSIRTDLIPEAYALELRQLQDAVPPFPTDEALAVLRKELGVRDTSSIFDRLSASPVASASIGQVYKGTLKGGGTEVAVKVQRPGILAEIALDLYILRLITPIQTYFQNAVNGVATAPEDIEVRPQLTARRSHIQLFRRPCSGVLDPASLLLYLDPISTAPSSPRRSR